MEGTNLGKYKITALILFGFSLFYFISSLKLKLGTTRYPGPGFIPLAIGILLLLCTGIYLLRVFGKKPAAAKVDSLPAGSGKNYLAIFGVLACTLIYPLVLENLKFLVSTTAAACGMLLFLKPQRVLFSLLLALGMAVASFLVFTRLLGVAFPIGALEQFMLRL